MKKKNPDNYYIDVRSPNYYQGIIWLSETVNMIQKHKKYQTIPKDTYSFEFFMMDIGTSISSAFKEQENKYKELKEKYDALLIQLKWLRAKR